MSMIGKIHMIQEPVFLNQNKIQSVPMMLEFLCFGIKYKEFIDKILTRLRIELNVSADVAAKQQLQFLKVLAVWDVILKTTGKVFKTIQC
jgi:hypothetical protein